MHSWPSRYHQWWECKFFDEGMIDQGGGFRDSVSDLAEELCPSSSDTPMPLPFFIRTPNQVTSVRPVVILGLLHSSADDRSLSSQAASVRGSSYSSQ